jgi:hypothetical protein
MRKKKKEILEIEIPSKAIRIQHACCSNGHSLMDAEHKINRYASVTVKAKYKDHVGLIHLDPIYGSFKNLMEITVPENEVVELFCPICDVSLTAAEQNFTVCSAPMFALFLPNGGIVEGCLRNGCHHHSLKVADGKILMKKLSEGHVLDSYL